MAQDRTGPGFGLNQDPYEVEQREMRRWDEEQAAGGYNCFGQVNHIHATERDAEGCQAEQEENL